MTSTRKPRRQAAPVEIRAPHPAAWQAAREHAARYPSGVVRLEQLPDGSVRVANVAGG
ncbi:hypothetical protein [Kribbella sp. CA-293567]|uniref:hypothetical protein n=1 Tax=Kribbella sp. CA-293567 TaxID=3002436 RepID=UPI0022DDB929|nr:hypothetical protein [Kribbella sp. CA-293567]WBQ03831.1 hypothetical protein OX958_28155 [Kribbella sp. CA-293567]